MNQLSLLLAVILVLATVIPISRQSSWWVRVLDFPRLQLCFLAVCTVILVAFFADGSSRLLALGIALVCLAYQFYWISPYTRFFKTEVDDEQPGSRRAHLSLLVANVLMTNRNAATLIDIIREESPDIILTLESDKWWEEEILCVEDAYPYTVKCPLDNLYGMHLYSKLALHNSEIKYLVEDGVPSIHAQIEIDDGEKIRAHFLHPYPPVPEYSDSSSERDAELIVVAKSLQEFETPTIVAGDLNDVAWSETTRLFRKISGLLDPRVGRGMYNTFNAYHWFLRWPLDHIFLSCHFQLADMRRLRAFGSDHFALFYKLAYCPTNKPGEEGLTAQAQDEDFAAEKIAQQDVETTDVPLDEKN